MIREARRLLERSGPSLAVPGRGRGRGPGLPRRGVAADPGAGPAGRRTTCSSSGTPTSGSTGQGRPAGCGVNDPGPVEPAADQLPHDRADPGLGDGGACRASRSTTSTAAGTTRGATGRCCPGPSPRSITSATRAEELEFLGGDGSRNWSARAARRGDLPGRPDQQAAPGRLPAAAQELRDPAPILRSRRERPRAAGCGWRRCTGSRGWSSR